METDTLDYALAAILSTYTEDGELHLIAFHSRTFMSPELNYDMHNKELLAIFEAFTRWRHYIEGSSTPVDVVTDHKNLEYFSTTKLLTRRQVRGSEYLAQFNLTIRFQPSRLGAKPDALTRRWDVYPKEGDNTYSTVNPQNCRPVFTEKQLTVSLQATSAYVPALHASIIMDTERLHSDIQASLVTDPVAKNHLRIKSDPHWTVSDDGLLRHDNRIYVPNANDLRLQVLQDKHDHVLSGHFGQGKTLDLV